MSVSYLIYWIFYVNELLESVQARLAQSVARQFRDPEFPVQTLPGANKFDKCSELTGLLPSHLSLAYISMREHQKIEALKDLMYHMSINVVDVDVVVVSVIKGNTKGKYKVQLFDD